MRAIQKDKVSLILLCNGYFMSFCLFVYKNELKYVFWDFEKRACPRSGCMKCAPTDKIKETK
jgi:hypothetical protein